MIDVAAQRKEAFERVCNIGFDLLRRHSRIEGRDHHHRHIDLGKKIDRHVDNPDYADQHHAQTEHDDEEGVLERKLRHYCAAPIFSPAAQAELTTLPHSSVPLLAGELSLATCVNHKVDRREPGTS